MNNESTRSMFEHVVRARRSIREFDSRPLTRTVIQSLIDAIQAKTDAAGNRTAPSAHALHPLRVFFMAADVDDMALGFYSVDHESGELLLLEERDLRPQLQEASLDDQPWISAAPCVVSICADFNRRITAFADQPPTGQRGVRYVYIEAGAAAQNALLAATSMGIGGVLVAGFNDDATASVLQLPEPLAPVLHLCFGWPDD